MTNVALFTFDPVIDYEAMLPPISVRNNNCISQPISSIIPQACAQKLGAAAIDIHIITRQMPRTIKTATSLRSALKHHRLAQILRGKQVFSCAWNPLWERCLCGQLNYRERTHDMEFFYPSCREPLCLFQKGWTSLCKSGKVVKSTSSQT